MADPTDDLRRYLRAALETLKWKLEGLSEYDVRRPLVPTGTNLLGLVKHVAFVTGGYFGFVFNRPSALPPFERDDPNADLWATPDESREYIVGLLDTALAEAEATLTELPLDAPGTVPWWGARGDVTLHMVAVHVIAEVHRHAGHADLVRELIDGQAGLRADVSNLPDFDRPAWDAYYATVAGAAESFRGA